MIAARWRNQEVPSFNGLVCANGEIYEVQDTRLVSAHEKPKLGSWLNVVVLAQEELYGGQYMVKCGEACEHGSVGVVVLESLQNQELIWSFVSEQSNPFDQIEVKAGYVLVLSTSGAVFRFDAPLKEAALLLPNPSVKRDWRKRSLNKQLLITRVEPPLSPAPYFTR